MRVLKIRYLLRAWASICARVSLCARVFVLCPVCAHHFVRAHERAVHVYCKNCACLCTVHGRAHFQMCCAEMRCPAQPHPHASMQLGIHVVARTRTHTHTHTRTHTPRT